MTSLPADQRRAAIPEMRSEASLPIFDPKSSLIKAVFEAMSRDGSVIARRRAVLLAKTSATTNKCEEISEAVAALTPFTAASSAPRAITSDWRLLPPRWILTTYSSPSHLENDQRFVTDALDHQEPLPRSLMRVQLQVHRLHCEVMSLLVGALPQ